MMFLTVLRWFDYLDGGQLDAKRIEQPLQHGGIYAGPPQLVDGLALEFSEAPGGARHVALQLATEPQLAARFHVTSLLQPKFDPL